MAQKRMFDRAVIRTDRFLDMPPTSQNLYFHLGIEADDEGFVSPKMIMRTLGSGDDDLKILAVKGFVIPFDTGVIVITEWHQNNYLDKNRLKQTQHQNERKQLTLTEQNTYVLNNGLTSIEESRVEESRVISEKTSFSPKTKNPTHALTDYFYELKGDEYDEKKIQYARHAKDAKDLLALCDDNLEVARGKLDRVANWANSNGFEEWIISTVTKKFLEVNNLK